MAADDENSGLMVGGPGNGTRLTSKLDSVFVTHDLKTEYFLRGDDQTPVTHTAMLSGWYGWDPQTGTWIWGR